MILFETKEINFYDPIELVSYTVPNDLSFTLMSIGFKGDRGLASGYGMLGYGFIEINGQVLNAFNYPWLVSISTSAGPYAVDGNSGHGAHPFTYLMGEGSSLGFFQSIQLSGGSKISVKLNQFPMYEGGVVSHFIPNPYFRANAWIIGKLSDGTPIFLAEQRYIPQQIKYKVYEVPNGYVAKVKCVVFSMFQLNTNNIMFHLGHLLPIIDGTSLWDRILPLSKNNSLKPPSNLAESICGHQFNNSIIWSLDYSSHIIVRKGIELKWIGFSPTGLFYLKNNDFVPPNFGPLRVTVIGELIEDGIYPSPSKVRQGISYGPTGSEYTGTEVLPQQSDVRKDIGYGSNGTEFVGTLETTGGSGSSGFSILGG